MNATADLPTWRTQARPGISLAQAMTAAASPLAPSPYPLVRTGAPSAHRTTLDSIIRPSARSRWRSATTGQYTPERVEYILRNGLAGDLTAQWELFDLMEDTWPRLLKCLGELKRAVSSMKFEVEPWSEDGEAPTPEAAERAKLVSHALWNMRPAPERDERDFTGTIFDLLDSWGKGVSMVELLWQIDYSSRFGQYITPRATLWVHPDNYGLDRDGHLGLRLPGSPDPQPLVPYKFLLATSKARTSHLCASALLRPLAWWWAASNFSAEWLLNFAQLFGIPIRWANYDPSSSDEMIDKICEMMADLGSAGWGAFPAGTTLQLYEAKAGGTTNPQASIMDRADTLCDLLILGQTLTSDAGDRGSQALGTVHERVRGDVIKSAADYVCGILNAQLVPALLDLNYGSDDFRPEIRAEAEEIRNEKADAERDEILIRSGMEIPKTWYHERHGVPLPAAGEETVSKPLAPTPSPLSSSPSPLAPKPSKSAQDDLGGVKTPPAPLQSNVPCGGTRRKALLQAVKSPEESKTGSTGAPPELEALIEASLADSIGARRKWLAPLRAEIRRLAAIAQDPGRSDADVLRLVEAARVRLPDLLADMDPEILATHLEATLLTAAATALENREIQNPKS